MYGVDFKSRNQNPDRIDCWVLSLSPTITTDEASLLDESDDYEVSLDFSEDETFQFWVQLFALCMGI